MVALRKAAAKATSVAVAGRYVCDAAIPVRRACSVVSSAVGLSVGGSYSTVTTGDGAIPSGPLLAPSAHRLTQQHGNRQKTKNKNRRSGWALPSACGWQSEKDPSGMEGNAGANPAVRFSRV